MIKYFKMLSKWLYQSVLILFEHGYEKVFKHCIILSNSKNKHFLNVIFVTHSTISVNIRPIPFEVVRAFYSKCDKNLIVSHCHSHCLSIFNTSGYRHRYFLTLYLKNTCYTTNFYYIYMNLEKATYTHFSDPTKILETK